MLYGLETTAQRNKYFIEKQINYIDKSLGRLKQFYLYNTAGSITISSIPGNCSIVFLSLPHGKIHSPDFKHLIKAITHWAKWNEYTKFYFSHNFETFFINFTTEFNFTPIGEPYLSRRTKAKIQWYQADILALNRLLKDIP